MREFRISIAKIARPKSVGSIPRKRLFLLLDDARKKPVIWVSGPAGSGKTTLVTNYLESRAIPGIWYQADAGDSDTATFFYYLSLAAKKAAPQHRKPLPLLTPEYVQGIAAFTKRYFEGLFSRLIPPFVIVFDNYQDVPPDSPFHEIMREGLSVIPDGIQAILISRSEPPSVLVGLRAQERMSVIGWDDVQFTLDETRAFIQSRKQKAMAEIAVKQLHEKMAGWAAGLVLLMEKLKTDSDIAHLDTLKPEEIFNYFAGEIFDKLDSETRDFLLMSCFLPRMTVHTAGKLTGHDDAGRILSRLSRNNFFTERHPGAAQVYQYHPLFRQFLLARIKESLNRQGLLHVQKRAASILVESGQAEDAAHLLREMRDWEQLAELALAHAPSLAAQGRNKTLEEWLSGIPAEILERTPLLLYWLGVCRMPYDLHESRGHFERAYELFKTRQDAAGLYSSWSGVVETYILERSVFTPIDYWISEIEKLLREHPTFPSPEIKVRVTAMIFFAMMYRQPNHPDFRLWEERLLAVLPGIEDVGLRTLLSSHLVFYYSWWSGELAKAELLIKNLHHSLSRLSEVHPFAYIVFRSNEAAHFMVTGRSDLSQEAVEDALKTAGAAGIQVWDFMLCLFGAHNALSDGNFEKARGFLDRAGRFGDNMRHLVEASHYHFQLAWEALCLGNPNVALEHVMAAIDMCAESGTPFLEGACKTGLAEALLELGRPEEALNVLEDARAIGRSCNSKTMEFQALLVQARNFLRLGKNALATEALRGHLRIGKECGIFSTPWWRPEIMVEIYSRALEEDIETDYVHEVIRRRRLVPDSPSVRVERWPWPVRIHTLGRFEVEINDKSLRFSGKVQQRPLLLLKALVTLGEKGAREEHAADLLWPDAEGDAGHNSLKMAVSRLRKMLGNDRAVSFQEGTAALDSRHCYVDAWAFEKLINEAENRGMGESEKMQKTRGRDGRSSPVPPLSVSPFHNILQKALSLYRGHFLPGDARHHWIVSYREKLRSKFLRIAAAGGDRFMKSGEFDKGVQYCRRAVEVDGCAEELYQMLMLFHQKLGERAEAIRVYERCRRMLAGELGVEPSPRTMDIYNSIKNRS